MPRTIDVVCEHCGRPDTLTVSDEHPEGERLAWECPLGSATGDDYDGNGNRLRRTDVDGCGGKNFTDGYHPAELQGTPPPAGAELVVMDGDDGTAVEHFGAG